ncbi:MAG: c-type cytochrome, partial [Planctomycetales bacterium]
WPYLSHQDRHIRFAARIALEHQPTPRWQSRTLVEKNPVRQIHAIIALARSVKEKKSSLQVKLLNALNQLDWSELAEPDRINLIRAYQLVLIRLGTPKNKLELIERLDQLYPASDEPLNRELCNLLVHLQAPNTVAKTLALLSSAQTQEEMLHYLLSLRLMKNSWTLQQRREYFQWFQRAHRFGGDSFNSFVEAIRKRAIANLSAGEKQALGDLVTLKSVTEIEPQGPPREFVREWMMEELKTAADESTSPRNLKRGQAVFAEASCFRCHRVAGRGGTVGPDLTGLGGRFGTHDILEAILDPDKVISDQYQATIFVLADGRTLAGHIADMGGDEYSLMTDMLRPRDYTKVRRDDVEEMSVSRVSMMPSGLLDTFTKEDILDLVAYLRSGGPK